MAVAAPALLIGAGVAALAGTAISAVGQIQQGQQAAAAAEAQGEAAAQAAQSNARIAERQAQIARDQALIERRRSAAEAEIFARDARRRQGARVSAIGASGLQLSGSFIDVLHDAALSDEQSRLFILMEGEDRARARLAGASIEDMSAAEFARQAQASREVGAFAAKGAKRAGAFGAAGTILTGATQAGLLFSQSPTFRRGLATSRASSIPGPGSFNPGTGMFGRV